jgi:hypothetical protein
MIGLRIAAGAVALLALVMGCQKSKSPPVWTPPGEPPSSGSATPPTPSPAIVLSASIPGDASFTPPFDSLGNIQKDFDIFSWNSFIALSWPPGPDGTGDPSKLIGAQGDNPTVWELYPDAGAIFLPNGATPSSPPATPIPDACKAIYAPGDKLLTQVGKTPTVLTAMSQPFNTGPLPDQGGVYARFELAVNQTMYGYILANTLYSKAGQKAFTGPVTFACGALPAGGKAGAEGAIMVKTAWKVITADDKVRFHSAQALVYSPASTNPAFPASCTKQLVGLVGMHIVHKTNSAAQWVWSTFEHVDNAPTEAEVASGKLRDKYNFYNPKCSAASCPPNQVPPRPWIPTRQSAFHTQVVRVDEFKGNEFAPQSAAARNADAQKLLAGVNPQSVWKNYQLISTQWPTATGKCAAIPGNPLGTPAPNFLANTTLETYIQGMTPNVSSSCMGCHNNATMTTPVPSDFTYLLTRAQ